MTIIILILIGICLLVLRAQAPPVTEEDNKKLQDSIKTLKEEIPKALFIPQIIEWLNKKLK